MWITCTVSVYLYACNIYCITGLHHVWHGITCNTQVRLITAWVCVHATCIMVYTNMKLWSVWYVIMVEVKLIWYTFYNINCMTVTSYTNIQAMIPNEITALKINRLMDMHAWSQGIYSIAITLHGISYEKCTIPYRSLYMLTME